MQLRARWPSARKRRQIRPETENRLLLSNIQPERIFTMKTKTILLLAVLASATPAFALPPPRVKPQKHGMPFKLVFRSDFLEPSQDRGYSPSPSSGMAAAVAITGLAAAGLRMLEEATKPPTVPVIVTTPSSNTKVVLPPELNKPDAPPVIVIPADTGVTSVHVVEMEPVVKHPVPITVIPMEIMSSK